MSDLRTTKMGFEEYFKWRDEVYAPRMRELHSLKAEIESRHREELKPIESQIASLAKENTDNLGGPN